MKIIDKQKDFYDWVVSKYGCDEKLILDRRVQPLTTPDNLYDGLYGIYIGGKIIELYIKESKIYIGKDLENISEKNKFRKNALFVKDGKYSIALDHLELTPVFNDSKYKNLAKELLEEDIHIAILKKPIFSDGYIIKYPRLSDFKIASIISAEEIWILLSESISKSITRKEPIVPIGTDKEKIKTYGFDEKTSFRGNAGNGTKKNK